MVNHKHTEIVVISLVRAEAIISNTMLYAYRGIRGDLICRNFAAGLDFYIFSSITLTWTKSSIISVSLILSFSRVIFLSCVSNALDNYPCSHKNYTTSSVISIQWCSYFLILILITIETSLILIFSGTYATLILRMQLILWTNIKWNGRVICI